LQEGIILDEDYYLDIWLDAWSEQFKDKNKALEILRKLSDNLNMPIREIVEHIDIIAGYPEFSYELLEKIADIYNSKIDFPKESISSIKKTNQIL
jgi:ribosome maturation protein Sdo1